MKEGMEMKKAGVLNLMGLLLSLPADLLWIWVLGGTLWMGMSRLSIGQEGMTVQFDFQPQILPWLLLMLAALLLWLLGFIFSLRNTVRAFRCRLQKRADWCGRRCFCWRRICSPGCCRRQAI